MDHAVLAAIEHKFMMSVPPRPTGLEQILFGGLEVSKELLRIQKQIFRSALRGLEDEARCSSAQFSALCCRHKSCSCM